MDPQEAGERQKALSLLFEPKTVAVIGASDKPAKLGFHVMKSLIDGGYEGKLIPVNPNAVKIMGLPAVSDVEQAPGAIDLAVVVLPATLVPGIFKACGKKGIRAVVLITAGFKEIDDPEGGEMQDALARIAEKAGITVIGPNTFGIVNCHKNLNASFTPEFSMVEKGPVALVSQSGGFSHLLAFMAMRQGVGLSKIVGLGNRLNTDFGDMLDFLMQDPATTSIALYLEGLDNPLPFLAAATAHRGKKPVVAYKTGRAHMGDEASLSHTGSLAGNQDIYEGALTQAGILNVNSSEALLDTAHALSLCALPKGPRVAILSGQAGPAMAACDVCEAEGLKMAVFSKETRAVIHGLLPPLALRKNPVDMGPAWYDSGAIRGIVQAVMQDPQVDGIVLLMMFASANREALSVLSQCLGSRNPEKPITGCLLAPPGIWDQEVQALEEAKALVHLPTPERAAKVMVNLWRYAMLFNKSEDRRQSGSP